MSRSRKKVSFFVETPFPLKKIKKASKQDKQISTTLSFKSPLLNNKFWGQKEEKKKPLQPFLVLKNYFLLALEQQQKNLWVTKMFAQIFVNFLGVFLTISIFFLSEVGVMQSSSPQDGGGTFFLFLRESHSKSVFFFWEIARVQNHFHAFFMRGF